MNDVALWRVCVRSHVRARMRAAWLCAACALEYMHAIVSVYTRVCACVFTRVPVSSCARDWQAAVCASGVSVRERVCVRERA